MEAYDVFKDLAIIIIAAKFFGILARKCKAPQVVGEIIAGLIIGPSILGLVNQSDFLIEMAEIGVIILMFSAGLETDLKDLMKTGPIAALIACAGVFVPLILGALLYMGFYGVAPWGSEGFYKAVFVGTILTATSVSITVEALKEMGKLKGKVGTTILSAAIIDDVIGIIVLTFVMGFKSPDSNPASVVVNTVLFFIFAIVVGFVCFKIFKFVHKGFRIHSKQDGYQFLHIIWPRIFCQHRFKDKFRKPECQYFNIFHCIRSGGIDFKNNRLQPDGTDL